MGKGPERVKAPKTETDPAWQVLLRGSAFGILIVLPLLWLQITPVREQLYHELLPISTVYQGMLIDLLVVMGLSIGFFWWLERMGPRWLTFWWILVVALLAERVFRTLINAAVFPQRGLSGPDVFLAIAGVCLLLRLVRHRWYSGLIRGVQWALLLFGFTSFWLLPEMVVMAVHAEPHGMASFSKPVAHPATRRIVWILLDEASYDQIFDHRQPDVDFPNFDRFAQSSVSFRNVQPAGYFTELVIPSLFSGEMITKERSDLDGRLQVKSRQNPHWRPYPDRSTIFADAQRLGWSTGVVGWYNPYCRTYRADLNDCYWILTVPLQGHYDPEKSALWNATAPAPKSLLRLFGRRTNDPTAWQIHTKDYEALMSHAHTEITDDKIGFLFLHLPVPHPGGIYNRKTHMIGVSGSYLDNLVLADETLGELVQEIQQSALGPQTTVIVSSDHSWRIKLWKDTQDWRPEDARVSGGHFDPRPVLMVHFPGEENGVAVKQPFRLIDMHGMIEEMLAGRAGNAAALQAWVAHQTASDAR
jgi:Sulfatase